ncbi:MAG: NDP-hexose 2,3-dehydratase family protein [Patescibacteria group bacterium]|jgi:oxidase EvaA
MNKLHTWLKSLIKRSGFKIEWISLLKSSSWSLKKGKIVHKSGQFFKIIGVRFRDPQGILSDQPFIDQREIGTLGFLIREIKQEKEILVQAKIEPGNSHIIQLAPTCQATKSNSLRVHGGKEPPFSHLFTKEHPQVIGSTLQSEQGSRFFKKQNLNILALNNQELNIPESHQWIPVDTILNLLSEDYLVNTDARSVLVCSPWKELVNRTPFSKFKTTFANELKQSYNQEIKTGQFEKMKKSLSSFQQSKNSVEIIPLNQLINWKISDFGIEPIQKKPFQIKYLKVDTKSREVFEWDQPIIESYGQGQVDLICGRISGELFFNFKIIVEPGLHNHAELSPTICVEPGENKSTKFFIDYPRAKILKTVLQSDEGGRFYRDITKYRLIDIGEADLSLPGYWLNLAQIQSLLLKNGWFTNEARSALSLILFWL